MRSLRNKCTNTNDDNFSEEKLGAMRMWNAGIWFSLKGQERRCEVTFHLVVGVT